MSKIQDLTEAVDATGDMELPVYDPANGQPRKITVDQIEAYLTGPIAALTSTLMDWALSQSFRIVTAARNADGAVTTASIVWPDGVTGTYTADTLSGTFPGATDAWHASYNGTPAKTITQPAVTRDSNGSVTAQPAITIA